MGAAPLLIEGDETLAEAVARMAVAGVSVAPVLNAQGRPRGFVTETAIGQQLSSAVHGFYTPMEFRLGVPLLHGRVTARLAQAFALAGQQVVASTLRGPVARVPGGEPLAQLLREDRVSREYVVMDGGEVIGAFVLSPDLRRILEAVM